MWVWKVHWTSWWFKLKLCRQETAARRRWGPSSAAKHQGGVSAAPCWHGCVQMPHGHLAAGAPTTWGGEDDAREGGEQRGAGHETMTCQQTHCQWQNAQHLQNLWKKNPIPAARHFLQLQEETLALQPGCEWHKYETRSGLEIWTELCTLSSSDRKRKMTNPNLPGTWRLGWRSHSSTGIRPLAVAGHHCRSWIPTLSHRRLMLINVRNARAYINIVLLTSDLCLSLQTFIVLGSGNIIHRFNADPVLGLLSAVNPLRKAAIWMLSHWYLFSTLPCVITGLGKNKRNKTAVVAFFFRSFESLSNWLPLIFFSFCS